MVELDLAKFKTELEACNSIQALNEPKIDGKSYLHSACAQGFVRHTQAIIEQAEKLQDVESVVNYAAPEALKKQTPLFFAVNSGPNGFPEVVIILLKAGCNVNARDSDGRTPLSYASEHGQDDTLDLLLGRGADPMIGETKTKKTPLHIAIENGQFNAV